MNPSVETGAAPPDGPANPAAAVAAVREARRRLVAGQGLVRMILGLTFFVAFAMARAATDYKTEAHMQTVCLLVVAFIALAILLPPIVSRLRRRRGLGTVGQAEADVVRFFGHPGWLSLLAFLAMWAAASLVTTLAAIDAWRIPQARIDLLDTLVALACTALLAGLYGARGLRLRLWEDLLMAAGVAAAGLFVAFLRDRMRLEVMVMVLCVAAFASGLALHFRWRESLRAAPPEGVQP